MHSIRAGSHAESLEEMQVRLEESLGMLRKMYEKEGWFAERLFAFFLRRRSWHDDGVCGRGVRSLSGPVPGGTAQAGGAATSSMGPSNVSFTQFELPTAPTMPHTSGTTPILQPLGLFAPPI